MKSRLAPALLCLALLAPAGALAADPAPNEEKPAETTPPAEAPAQPGGDQKYGTFALDANGNRVTGDALKNIPPEAKWAMEAKGYSPVLGPNGEVLGYDNGMMCILPSAVADEYALANPGQAAAPTATAADTGVTADLGRRQEAAQAEGRVPKEGDLDFVGPLSPGFCANNPSAPACQAEREQQSPEDIARKEADDAARRASDAAAAGDRQATIDAIEAQRRAQDQYAKNDGETTPAADPGFGAFGVNGTGNAYNGPAPSAPTGGGQDIGAQGQVGGTGGALAGREVRGSTEQEADAMLAFQQGMKNGPLEGPRDASVASVAQVAQRGLGGRAMDAARNLFSTLSESISAAVDAPDTDLSDQLATSPIDGAAANRAPIKVTECDATQHDTLGTKGKKVRRAGGC